jgi:hypothetical protein
VKPSVFIAGAIYFALVFAAGFMLGTIRVLLVVPATGVTAAVLIETPFILTVAWFACRFAIGRIGEPPSFSDRMIMGATAFVLLMIAEYLLAYMLNATTLADYLAQYVTLPGLLGLAGQIVFATFPALQGLRSA